MSALLQQGGEVLNLYKHVGETPLERLERLRIQKKEYQDEVLSYAGRLDPMAEGVMLCLVGAANKQRESYLGLSKEYTFDVLFGFATDTYDILGRVEETGPVGAVHHKQVLKALNEFRGDVLQEYPPYSSKTVEGKSLFAWARQNALASLVIPKHTVKVFDIDIKSMYKVPEATLLQYIESSVEKVQGDFRQEEIMRTWRQYLRPEGKREFPCASITLSCASGTYARSIAHSIGKELKVPALALRIVRTKVGDYSIENSLR